MGDLFKNLKALFRPNAEKAQEEEVAKVSMNDGDHGTIFGFNRNIILGIFLAACSITAIAIIFATDEPTKEEKQATAREQHAASATAGKNEVNQFAMGYEELVKANQQYGGKGGQGRGNGSGPGQSPQNHRQEQPTTPVPQTSLPTVPQVAVPAAVQQTEEDREEAAYMQRMKSPIAFGVSGSGTSGNIQAQSGTGETGKLGDVPEESAASFGGASTGSQQSAVSYLAPGKYTLQAGTIIPVVLCTGINSDIGGQVVAQVQQDMYDTATGRNLLIPAGSKILGTYGKGSPNNSGRVEITFTSIVLPDGGSFAVGNSLVAIDGAGYSGITGKVDRHTSSMLSAGFFSSALAALGSYAGGNVNNSSNTYSPAQLAVQGATSNIMNAAAQLFQQGANQQMTVTAKPGTFFSIYVTQGLTLQRGGAR